MSTAQNISRWQEGHVDRTKEHFELRYESSVTFESDWSDWIPVAVIGPPKDHVVSVQLLVEPGDPNNEEAVVAVKKEIQFYLIDKREPEPWGYAKYHTGTGSNIYSHVHWGYFKRGNQEDYGQVRGQVATRSTADNRPELPRKMLIDGKQMMWIPEKKASTGPKD